MPLHSNANEIVQIETDRGVIKLELFSDDAPLTVENFLGYVDNGHYNGTFFHRSVPGFVLQCAGFAFAPNQGDFFSSGTSRIFQGNPVMNEPGISNLRGTVAMAKLGGDPDSATNQWFFNLADNSANLDSQNGGFTVFGQVIEDGMNLPTGEAPVSYYKFGPTPDNMAPHWYEFLYDGETGAEISGPLNDCICDDPAPNPCTIRGCLLDGNGVQIATEELLPGAS